MGAVLLVLSLSFGASDPSGAEPAAPAIVDSSFVYADPPFPFAHTSTIVELEPDRFLAASVGGPASRHVENDIWLARLDGKRWAPPVKVAEHSAASWNPVLWLDGASGELILFYKIGGSPESWTGGLKRSTDGGRNWSETELLPAGLTGPVRGKPLALDDGSLICGDSVESWEAWACWVNITSDLGRTWTRHGPVAVPGFSRGVIQPTIFWADEAHSTLRMLVRPSQAIGRVCTATSTDNGRTWTDARPIDLVNPNSAIDAVRLRDGRIAIAHNPTAEGRSVLSISLSSDGGLTWKRALDVVDESEGEYSYPALIEDSKGRLRMTFTWNKVNIRHVAIDLGRL